MLNRTTSVTASEQARKISVGKLCQEVTTGSMTFKVAYVRYCLLNASSGSTVNQKRLKNHARVARIDCFLSKFVDSEPFLEYLDLPFRFILEYLYLFFKATRK